MKNLKVIFIVTMFNLSFIAPLFASTPRVITSLELGVPVSYDFSNKDNNIKPEVAGSPKGFQFNVTMGILFGFGIERYTVAMGDSSESNLKYILKMNMNNFFLTIPISYTLDGGFIVRFGMGQGSFNIECDNDFCKSNLLETSTSESSQLIGQLHFVWNANIGIYLGYNQVSGSMDVEYKDRSEDIDISGNVCSIGIMVPFF